MKRLLLLVLLSLAGSCVSAAEDCFDRIAQEKGLDADLLRAIAFVESSGNPSASDETLERRLRTHADQFRLAQAL